MKIKFLNGEVDVNDRDLLLVVGNFSKGDLDKDDIYVMQYNNWKYQPCLNLFGTEYQIDVKENKTIRLNFIKKVDVGVPKEYLKLWKGEN